jgi:hypothetical protein
MSHYIWIIWTLYKHSQDTKDTVKLYGKTIIHPGDAQYNMYMYNVNTSCASVHIKHSNQMKELQKVGVIDHIGTQ